MYQDEQSAGPGADFYEPPDGQPGIAEAPEAVARNASGKLSPDRQPERCRVCLKPIDAAAGRRKRDYCNGTCKDFQNFWDAWQRAFWAIDWSQVPPERRAIVRGELVRAANHVPVAVQHTARDKRGRFMKGE